MNRIKWITFLLFLLSLYTKAQEVKIFSKYNYYTSEDKASVLFYFYDSENPFQQIQILNKDNKLLSETTKLDKETELSFPLSDLTMGENLLTIFLKNTNSVKDTTISITKLKSVSNEVKINQKTGGLLVNGLPFFPFGFYCGEVGKLPEQEVTGGFNLIGPYQSNLPEGLEKRKAYMDRCAELGVKVQYGVNSLIGSGHNGAKAEMTQEERFEILKKEVLTFKDHPALLSWYINDEPAGQGRDPKLMEETYNIIHKLDPYHPISMVFMMPSKADKYTKGMDIAMTDPYPVPKSVTEVQYYVKQLNGYFKNRKSIWMVPQAFGGSEMWPREPTAKEIRAMTYLGLIEGIQGVQYFIHTGLNINPQSVSMWSECRNMAVEFNQMTPFITDFESSQILTTNNNKIIAREFTYKGDHLIVAVNTTNEPYSYSIKTNIHKETKADLWFENRTIDCPKGTLSDIIDALSTRVYLIKSSETEKTPDGNLIYNPGFEKNETPGLSAGHHLNYSFNGKGDPGATVFSDSRTSKNGLFSLRLITPKDSAGKKVQFSPVAVGKDASYRFSIWAKAKKEAKMPEFSIQIKALKVKKSFTLSSKWKEYSFMIHSDSSSTNTIVDLDLIQKGTAWFDDIKLSQEPFINYKINDDQSSAMVSIKTGIPNTTLKYTSNGKSKWQKYKSPFELNSSSTIKARVYEGKKYVAESSVFVPINKALGKQVTFITKLDPAYSSEGPSTITNGLMGSTVFKDGKWLGFTTPSVSFVIDMGEKTDIKSITPSFLSDANSGIFLPRNIKVSVSDDGDNFKEITTTKNSEISKRGEPYLVPININCNEKGRFIRFDIKPFGKIPEGYLFKGTTSWLFIDEVIVK